MSNQEAEKEYRPLLADLSDREGVELCAQLRQELVADVSKTGGHLASNLGAVELTVAIHRVFDTRRDRLVFDVGHQCYPHKILTGRKEEMSTLRQYGGIAGFPKPGESVHDAFIAGHASNSVSVALGMARARTLLQEDYKVLALIGDGALTGGLAYEGLSNAGECGQQLLVILNDNGMSITPNVGAVADHLAKQRLAPPYLSFKRHYRKVMNASWLGRKIYGVTHRIKQALKQSLLPCSMFENMGFNYLGPIDGHDLSLLTRILRYAKDLNEPVLLHVKTVKGKGYLPAEENADAFHGVSPFDPLTGRPLHPSSQNFSAVFGETLTRLGRKDSRVCAITAAMMSGTGLDQFRQAYPARCYDVGIAEGCAVSMAAGMAKQGAIPVFAVYSTFLQRSYDMLVHDVAIDQLHVVFGVDRAGLVGEDGETHHGVFDVAYLDSIPGITVLAPASFAELESMLERAVLTIPGPVAVRYPRGGEGEYRSDNSQGANAVLRWGNSITLVGYGVLINDLLAAAQVLEEQGIDAEVIKLNTITPLHTEEIISSVKKTGHLLVAEDCMAEGSVGQRLSAALAQSSVVANITLINCGNRFVTHGALSCLKKELGLDGDGIVHRALEVLRHG
ncbi:1-deoxy-D-xylulose-5-phosphate synthase [Flavonifractor sp. An100]|uniref:1-deoxy-D-xylulose-5-phosphate synthase n=1 Tax=Flavonifractor sp. An100 TaxID=1965538 RepID=UPI001FA89ACC|nr:1-deoxy-D-xylulose-5-phosphate synthase [Flavonifractor sp. An100]